MKISFKAYTSLKLITLAIFIMIIFSFESELRSSFVKLLICYELLQYIISVKFFKDDSINYDKLNTQIKENMEIN